MRKDYMQIERIDASGSRREEILREPIDQFENSEHVKRESANLMRPHRFAVTLRCSRTNSSQPLNFQILAAEKSENSSPLSLFSDRKTRREYSEEQPGMLGTLVPRVPRIPREVTVSTVKHSCATWTPNKIFHVAFAPIRRD